MNDINIAKHLDAVRDMIRGLSPEQAGIFKDRLLSMLLFEDNQTDNGSNQTRFESLTREEKEMILKLARQAEELHRLMRDQQKEDQ